VTSLVWDLELEKTILDRDIWKSIGKKGFDDPRFFAAYMRTLRWKGINGNNFRHVNVVSPWRSQGQGKPVFHQL
jgi:hypothetical protein